MSERPVKYCTTNLVIGNLEQYKFSSSKRVEKSKSYGRYHSAEKTSKSDSIPKTPDNVRMPPSPHDLYICIWVLEADARTMEGYYLRRKEIRNFFQTKQGTTDRSTKCNCNARCGCCAENLATFGWKKNTSRWQQNRTSGTQPSLFSYLL